MKKKFLAALIFCLPVLINYSALAQKADTHDSTYYKTFPHSLTPRFYFSQKYADMTFQSADGSKDLQYRANTKLNMGIGATYNNLTLNVAFGFGFLNNNIEEKGKSKSLDLQLHLYPNGWAADLLAMHYKGVYAYPKRYAADNLNTYYYRPDIKLNLFGVTAYRVANAKRFSYRAAMVQNEWQKKSAGSLLYGGGIYYSGFQGDSSIIPSKVSTSFSQAGIDNFHFITIGPGIGYVYTIVAGQHLFLMGSLIANANMYFSTDENNNAKNNKTSFEPAAVYKAAAGYNGNVWDVSVNWAGNAFLVKEAAVSKANFLSTGNFRLIIAKKIMLKKKSS
jgi:uncharacterized protein DUF4421